MLVEAFWPAAVFLLLYANVTILNAYCDAGLTCWFTIARNPSFFGGHAAGFMRFAICLVWTIAVVLTGYWLFFCMIKLSLLLPDSALAFLIEPAHSVVTAESSSAEDVEPSKRLGRASAAALVPYYMLSIMLCMIFARRANSLALHIKEKFYDPDLLNSDSSDIVHAPDMLHNINRYIHSDYKIYQIVLRYGWYLFPTMLCLICEPAYRHRDDLRSGLAQYLVCKYGANTILSYFEREIAVSQNTIYLQEILSNNSDLHIEDLAFTLLMAKIGKSKMHVTESSIRRYIASPIKLPISGNFIKRVPRHFLERPTSAKLRHDNGQLNVKLVQRSEDDLGFFIGIDRPEIKYSIGQRLQLLLKDCHYEVEVQHTNAKYCFHKIITGIGVKVLLSD